MFFYSAWIVGGWGVAGWVRKSYWGPAEIASFSSRDFRRRNKHDTFWHIDWIFLLYIFMNHCCFRFSSLGNLEKLRTSLVYYHFYSQQPHRWPFLWIYLLASNIIQNEINFLIKIHVFDQSFLYWNLILNVKYRSSFF